MSDSKQLWDIALAGCGDITKKMSEISKQIQDLTQSPDWPKIAKQTYFDHKYDIDSDMKEMISDYDDGLFYNSGVESGEIFKYFLNFEPEISSVEAD